MKRDIDYSSCMYSIYIDVHYIGTTTRVLLCSGGVQATFVED